MHGPDGPEERTALREERYERDIDDADVADQLADDECGCDDGRYCETHAAEAEAEHAYLRNVPRHQVINDAQSREEYAQELRDAGRGHLVRP